MKKETYKYK